MGRGTEKSTEHSDSLRNKITKTQKHTSCPEKHYRQLMMSQMQIYKSHINMHLRLHPHISGKEKSITHFFDRFGSIFRQIYCGFACEARFKCSVRSKPCFNIKKAYAFTDLGGFPHDFSLGEKLEGCSYQKEHNAVQLFIAQYIINNNLHREYYGLCHFNASEHTQAEKEKHIKVFLSAYGCLLRDMFCGTICPASGRCGNSRTASA